MRQEFQETGQEQLFSRRLIAETEATLARGEQAIILLNRRGYSFVVMCRACGERLECENCAIALTHHSTWHCRRWPRFPIASSIAATASTPSRRALTLPADAHARAGQRLECHYCGFRRTVPKLCPKCESEHLYFLGAGSQQGEQRLQEIFPHARIGRMDRDTVRSRHDMERLLTRLHSGEINLLVGTQMIAKGHDIHGVTLVGVVGADYALNLPDFRAAERVFQLLTQVSGRAGRGESPGRVVVQSYHPDHYAIQCAQAHDYRGFTAKELKYRNWMHYPPFGVMANILVRSGRMEEAAGWAAALGQMVPVSGAAGHPRAGPGGCADREDQTHLSLPSAAQGGTARSALPRPARCTRLRGPGGHSPQWPGLRYGCDQPDVITMILSGRAQTREFEELAPCHAGRCSSVDQMQLFAGLEAHSFARSDGDFRAGAGIAADAGLARPHVEHAKAAQLDAFPSRQRLFQALKDGVDCGLRLVAGKAGPFDYPVHDVLLDQGILQEWVQRLCCP